MKLLYCGFFLSLNVFVSTTGHSLKTFNKCENIQSGDCSNITTNSFFDIYNREGSGNSFSGRVNVTNSEPTTRHAKRTHRVPKRKGRRRGVSQHRYSTRVLSLKPSDILLPPFELHRPKSNDSTIDPFVINLHSDDTKTSQKNTSSDNKVKKNTFLHTKLGKNTYSDTDIEKNTHSDTRIEKNTYSDTRIDKNTYSDTKVEAEPIEEVIPFNNLVELNLLLTPPLPDDTKTAQKTTYTDFTEVEKNTYTDSKVEKNTSLESKVENTYSDKEIRKNTYSDTDIEKNTNSDTKPESPMDEVILFNNVADLNLLLTPPLPDDTETAQRSTFTDTKVEKNSSLQTKVEKNNYSDSNVGKNTHSDSKAETPMEEVIPFNNVAELNLLLTPPLPDESDFTEFISFNDKINEEVNTFESVKIVNPEPQIKPKHNISFSNIIHVLDNNFTQNLQNYNDFTSTIRPNEEFIYNLTSKDYENRPFNEVETFSDKGDEDKSWSEFNGTLLAPEVAELGMKVVTSAKGAELMRRLTQDVKIGGERSAEDRAPGSLQTAETGHYFRKPPNQRLTQSNELSAQEAYQKMRKQLNPYKTCRGGKGFIPDLPSGCQFFYVCLGGGGGEAMMCPQGTLFNQEYLVCDWDYNVDCGSQSL